MADFLFSKGRRLFLVVMAPHFCRDFDNERNDSNEKDNQRFVKFCRLDVTASLCWRAYCQDPWQSKIHLISNLADVARVLWLMNDNTSDTSRAGVQAEM